ncbi:glycerophosphodiester phosphodiesterase [soil metagenome]
MQKNSKKPLIIAHRGASEIAPENTLAAFQKALEDGAEGIEFDVQLAKDGVPIVFHDFRLERIGQKKGRVADFTSLELQNLDVGSWFNLKNPNKADHKFSEEVVPTLVQLLDFLNDYKGLIYVELKCKDEETSALVEAVCKTIRNSNLLPLIIVKSFNLEAIFQIKQLLPEVRTAALFAPKIRTILHYKRLLVEKAERYTADELSIHLSLATESFVQKAGRNKFLVTIWTANNVIWVKRAADLGINAIITNNPAKFLAKKQEIFADK